MKGGSNFQTLKLLRSEFKPTSDSKISHQVTVLFHSQRLSADWMSDHHEEVSKEQAGPGFGAQEMWFPIAFGRCVTSCRSLNLSELRFP